MKAPLAVTLVTAASPPLQTATGGAGDDAQRNDTIDEHPS